MENDSEAETEKPLIQHEHSSHNRPRHLGKNHSALGLFMHIGFLAFCIVASFAIGKLSSTHCNVLPAGKTTFMKQKTDTVPVLTF